MLRKSSIKLSSIVLMRIQRWQSNTQIHVFWNFKRSIVHWKWSCQDCCRPIFPQCTSGFKKTSTKIPKPISLSYLNTNLPFNFNVSEGKPLSLIQFWMVSNFLIFLKTWLNQILFLKLHSWCLQNNADLLNQHPLPLDN